MNTAVCYNLTNIKKGHASESAWQCVGMKRIKVKLSNTSINDIYPDIANGVAPLFNNELLFNIDFYKTLVDSYETKALLIFNQETVSFDIVRAVLDGRTVLQYNVTEKNINNEYLKLLFEVMGFTHSTVESKSANSVYVRLSWD